MGFIYFFLDFFVNDWLLWVFLLVKVGNNGRKGVPFIALKLDALSCNLFYFLKFGDLDVDWIS